jgi:hypothetical protein
MAKVQPDPDVGHIRDLAELRRLETEHGDLRRGSPEWLEHEARVAILSRRIRAWATDDEEAP